MVETYLFRPAELAEGFAASRQPEILFDPNCLHWRERARVGLGRWLLEELAKDSAFLSQIP